MSLNEDTLAGLSAEVLDRWRETAEHYSTTGSWYFVESEGAAVREHATKVMRLIDALRAERRGHNHTGVALTRDLKEAHREIARLQAELELGRRRG